MKLKNIKYIFLLVAAGLTMQSCQDMLDLDPQDQLGGNKMWKSANDFKYFANNFYTWTTDFSSIYSDGSYHSDTRSDIMTFSSPNVTSKGTNTVPASDGFYTDNYRHIRRTNMLIINAESYGIPEEIKQYVGEAYFFRAYCYFNLMQVYGDVIWTDGVLDVTSGELQAKRNTRSEVMDKIVSDLNNAIDRLPAYSALTTDENGRVSKEAAQALLSRAALYEGTWQKFHNNDTQRATELLDIAAKAAKAVIDSKTFTLFGTDSKTEVLGDSAQKYLFILENEKSNPAGLQKADNHEYILARRHDQTLAPIGKNITKECVANVQWITRNFVNLYLCSDGLPIDKSPLFKGYDKKNSEWQNRDNRMRYNLLMPGTRYFTNMVPRTAWDASDYANANEYSSGSGSGYANQKWGCERSVADTQEGYDYPVFRYAEVLLNYAEAVFERDGKISDEDLNISLNLVRNRVNKEMPKLSNSFVESNGLDMQTEIRRERTIELYQEGFRLDDLKRWNTAVQTMNLPLLGVKFVGTEFETHWGTSTPSQQKDSEGCLIMDTNRKWTEKNYLFPLPADQLQLNPNLEQNPGWE